MDRDYIVVSGGWDGNPATQYAVMVSSHETLAEAQEECGNMQQWAEENDQEFRYSVWKFINHNRPYEEQQQKKEN